jgi:hypothetical protein
MSIVQITEDVGAFVCVTQSVTFRSEWDRQDTTGRTSIKSRYLA